jgi:hypothetical protein
LISSQPIIFLGCSFTWGEGLELFQNDEKWIEERSSPSDHTSIRKITDAKSTNFRKSNRFGGLVATHYNTTALIHPENGGSLANGLRYLENTLKTHPSPRAIIFQNPPILRSPYHLTYSCNCQFCLDTEWRSLHNFWDWINLKKDKVISDDELFNWNRKEWIHKLGTFYERIVNDAGILKSDDYYAIYNKWNVFVAKRLDESLPWIINEFKETEKTIPIYFLDSWHKETSEHFSNYSYFNERTIPLIGGDGNEYMNWVEWSKTINKYVISDCYPKSCNDHPSLESHKLIADSIIRFLG